MMQMQRLPLTDSNCLFVSLTSNQTRSRGLAALEISPGSLMLLSSTDFYCSNIRCRLVYGWIDAVFWNTVELC